MILSFKNIISFETVGSCIKIIKKGLFCLFSGECREHPESHRSASEKRARETGKDEQIVGTDKKVNY